MIFMTKIRFQPGTSIATVAEKNLMVELGQITTELPGDADATFSIFAYIFVTGQIPLESFYDH